LHRGQSAGCDFANSRAAADIVAGQHVTTRCDHCRGRLGRSVERYWHMRFCCSACTSAYRRRLAEETKLKIEQLDVAADAIVPTFGGRFLKPVGRHLPG
jgi:hypothetical protein